MVIEESRSPQGACSIKESVKQEVVLRNCEIGKFGWMKK